MVLCTHRGTMHYARIVALYALTHHGTVAMHGTMHMELWKGWGGGHACTLAYCIFTFWTWKWVSFHIICMAPNWKWMQQQSEILPSCAQGERSGHAQCIGNWDGTVHTMHSARRAELLFWAFYWLVASIKLKFVAGTDGQLDIISCIDNIIIW